MIDGKLTYFRREPSSVVRFCEDAKRRAKRDGTTADREPDKGERWHLVDHLKQVVAQGEQGDSPFVNPVRHHIDYMLTIPANTAGGKKGSMVRVWLPFPQEYRQQRE